MKEGPTAPLRSFITTFTQDKWHGGPIDGAVPRPLPKGTTHAQADSKVLDEAFAKWIAERELEPFDGDPLRQMP